MKIGDGVEKWMVLLPIAGLAVLVTVYVGGPDQALDSLERLAYDGWHGLLSVWQR